MPSEEDVAQQQELLAIYRRNLTHYLVQQAKLESLTPVGILNGILEERAKIKHVKDILRGWNVAVEDHPDDESLVAGATGAGEVYNQDAHIPYPRNQVFIGRDDELRRLGEWLAQPGAAVVVAGLGGVGKTQLAAEFAHACAEDRATWGGGVFWVPMIDPAGAGTAVAGAGRALGQPGYDALTLPEQIAAVRRAWAGPERRLLVFDNSSRSARRATPERGRR